MKTSRWWQKATAVLTWGALVLGQQVVPFAAHAQGNTEESGADKAGAVEASAGGEASASGSGEASAVVGVSGEGRREAEVAGRGENYRTSVLSLDPNEPLPPGFVASLSARTIDGRKAPSKAQVKALLALEAEKNRYQLSGEAYKRTLASIVERDYLRRKRVIGQEFGEQIGEEEVLQGEARDKAIARLEAFVQRYPEKESYTPDAMFRLGELYFEQSQIRFQEALDASASGKSEGPELGTPDYTPTIRLYHQLAKRFPSYRRIDGVYYLIGFCLQEMGEIDDARLAWLNLVCANKFRYEPDAVAIAKEETSEDDQRAKYPSLGLDQGKGGPAVATVKSYEGCTPVSGETDFRSETWFRIGEYHFDDYGDSNGLGLAISAYNMILADPADRNYGLALYKVAWAYYRASRYPEAIKHFAILVDWSDQQQKKTGQAGSELRPEAIQYLGISFAYEDWDENQVPDVAEGLPSGFQRIQDVAFMPQDRPWTPEVYFQLGDVFYDESRYPEAIETWSYAVDRWALHASVPEVTDKVARAYLRQNDFASATEWRLRLGTYREGSAWWQANMDHPKEQQMAEQLAETGVISGALFHHRQAQQFRRNCVEQQDLALCETAQQEYRAAADGYREYLKGYPNNPQAYELHYNLADALYWSEDYEGAAEEYAVVRDSNLEDKYLSESARRVVESVKRNFDKAVAEGGVTVRAEPPVITAQATAVPRYELPPVLVELAHAREMYISRVSDEQDREKVLKAYDYNNALLLYFYGYWYNAKLRFERIFESRCSGPNADDTGRVAWLSLRNIAVSLNDTDEVERLGTLLRDKECTFSSGGVVEVDCSDADNRDHPQCLAGSDLVNVRYRRAIQLFTEAEAATGEKQIRLYESAAETLVQAVNDEPNHPEAPLALEKAAVAYERTSRFESAATLYQRIVDEVGPKTGATAEEQGRLDAILANAYFRLAYNANRFFEFERAVDSYTTLASSKRFAQSRDPGVIEKREDALINASLILEWLQRYPEAGRYYARAAASVSDESARRTAYFRLAETKFKQKDWQGAISGMRDFTSRYDRDPQAGDLTVKARWRIAQSFEMMRDRKAYRQALDDVAVGFSRSGLPAGSAAAEYAAEAKFRAVDGGLDTFEQLKIDPGTPRTLDAYVKSVIAQIEQAGREAKGFADGYNAVLQYKRPNWTIAAFMRQGRVYEVLARAVLNTPFLMPTDMQKQLRKLPPDQREDIRFQVEDRIRVVLDERVRPIECLAVARYALAVRASRAGNLDNEYSQMAVDRLQAYGDERIGECIESARKQDPTFAAYEPGEFARAPRGQLMDVKEGSAPPAIRLNLGIEASVQP